MTTESEPLKFLSDNNTPPPKKIKDLHYIQNVQSPLCFKTVLILNTRLVNNKIIRPEAWRSRAHFPEGCCPPRRVSAPLAHREPFSFFPCVGLSWAPGTWVPPSGRCCCTQMSSCSADAIGGDRRTSLWSKLPVLPPIMENTESCFSSSLL